MLNTILATATPISSSYTAALAFLRFELQEDRLSIFMAVVSHIVSCFTLVAQYITADTGLFTTSPIAASTELGCHSVR